MIYSVLLREKIFHETSGKMVHFSLKLSLYCMEKM